MKRNRSLLELVFFLVVGLLIGAAAFFAWRMLDSSGLEQNDMVLDARAAQDR
ncbi:hypothetical protein M8312_00845 [Sphingomonas sp. KRR8]|uniref:hypothetical protein n=1 Tax=Sphingomonas sp. KRR8 TaxID=2942996 RepID=UPI0020206802|nr:hypothetical protein [Sphingomonas sp. KRR8]URD61100.1 hypothetical protein M8312_00845 [Sphingomonas sp. KRR8]